MFTCVIEFSYISSMHILSTSTPIFLCLRAGRLQCGSDEVRTAGKRTILCCNETNPTQVSVLNTFSSAQFINKGGDSLTSAIILSVFSLRATQIQQQHNLHTLQQPAPTNI